MCLLQAQRFPFHYRGNAYAWAVFLFNLGWQGPSFSGHQIQRRNTVYSFKECRTSGTQILKLRKVMGWLVLYIGEIIQTIIPKRYHSNQSFNFSKAQKRWRDSRNNLWICQESLSIPLDSDGPGGGLGYILQKAGPGASKLDLRVSLWTM